MRVLMLGGGRFQGRRAAEMLVEAGHSLTLFHHGEIGVPGARHIRGNREEITQHADLFRKGDYDVVIDTIAYEPGHVRDLLPLLCGRAGHYMLISSFVVYGGGFGTGLCREEEADLALESGGAYDVGKRKCESILHGEQEMPWTILRFANLEGPGDPSNRRGFFIDRVADGEGLLLPSDVEQPFQPFWRDDAARAVTLAAGNPAAYGKTYNVAGGEIFTLTEWLGVIADVIGHPYPFIVRLPLADLRRLLGFTYRAPLPMRPLLDLSRIQGDLGYHPTPARHWLGETVSWWRSSGLTSSYWEHRPTEVSLLRRFRGWQP